MPLTRPFSPPHIYNHTPRSSGRGVGLVALCAHTTAATHSLATHGSSGAVEFAGVVAPLGRRKATRLPLLSSAWSGQGGLCHAHTTAPSRKHDLATLVHPCTHRQLHVRHTHTTQQAFTLRLVLTNGQPLEFLILSCTVILFVFPDDDLVAASEAPLHVFYNEWHCSTGSNREHGRGKRIQQSLL